MYQKSLNILNIAAAISCIIISFNLVVFPNLAKLIFSDQYKTLMFQCDNVMKAHLIAKNRVLVDKSESSVNELKASEIGLLSCHDYDKLRKKMLNWGLNENDLAIIGLEALEENSKDIMDFVNTHEFKY